LKAAQEKQDQEFL
jgi:predicted DNA-binding WGR domain protein